PLHAPRLPMSELSVVAQILSSGVGLVGALVAGLSVYFTYKSRHNLLRQVVYGRQMDAYFDITGSLTALFTAAQNALALSNPRLKAEDARDRFRAALREDHERFIATVNRSLIVLPSKVKAGVDHFNEVLLALGAPPEELAADDSEPTRDPGQALARAYGR